MLLTALNPKLTWVNFVGSNKNDMGKNLNAKSRRQMMKKKLMISITCIISVSLLMMAGAAIGEEYPQIKLRYANFAPEKAPTSKADIFVAEELTRRTNGRVKVTLYHGGSMGKSTEMIDLVGEGAIEIGNFSSAYNFARLPMQIFGNVPIVMDSAVMAGRVARGLFATQPKMREDLKKNNLHVFNVRGLTPYRLISTKPIRKIEDLKGLRVRTFGKISPKMFKDLGAVPVTMTVSESYEALQRGSVDAVYFSWTIMKIYKLHEVAKYLSDINFGANICYFTYINLDVWNSWPQNLKDLFNQVATEAAIRSDYETDKLDVILRDQMIKEGGLEYIHFEDQDKLIEAIKDPVGIPEAQVAALGGDYVNAAKEAANWMRAELPKMK
jgi:TRAP-type C4-dicarboxylate transport system substrate-binding protein